MPRPAAACVARAPASTAGMSCGSRPASAAGHAGRRETPPPSAVCPRADVPGFVRAEHRLVRLRARGRPAPPLPPGRARRAARWRRKKGDGLCDRCWQRHPDRARSPKPTTSPRLEDPPGGWASFAEFAAERHCMARACVMITAVGRLLDDDQPIHPQALLERSRRPGRSAGALARTLEDFFVTTSPRLRPRSRRPASPPAAGSDGSTRPRAVASGGGRCSANTSSGPANVPAGPAPIPEPTSPSNRPWPVVRDLARFLVDERAKTDWATVQTADIEAFLNAQPANRRRRLAAARQFFRWARRTSSCSSTPPARDAHAASRVHRQTLTIAEQRRLFRRWTTDPDVHPHEALVGLLALLHACTERRAPRATSRRLRPRTPHAARRRPPAPGPARSRQLSTVPQRLPRSASRSAPATRTSSSPRSPRPRITPASTAYITHVLDPAGVRTEDAPLHPTRRPPHQPRPQARRRSPRHERRRPPRLPRRRRRHRPPPRT